jgi:thiazole tautomerase (transcriptional regulator TenI)
VTTVDAAIPVVHAVTDDEVIARADFLMAAAQVMEALGGRGAVHLRAAHATARTLVRHAERLARVQELSGCWLVVNDRVDVALATGARGAQLTSRSLRPDDARRVARPIAPALRLGASVHSPDDAAAAERGGADWVVAGHVFPTATHPDEGARGPGLVARVAAVVRVPVVAIGGITPARVTEVRGHGASGVAAIRGIWGAANAGRAAADYLSAYDAHTRDGPRPA